MPCGHPAEALPKIRGRVSMTVPTELASSWLPPLLSRFRQLHPAVDTVIHADDAALHLGGSDHDISLRTEFNTEPKTGADTAAVFPLELVCNPALLSELSPSLPDRLSRLTFTRRRSPSRPRQRRSRQRSTAARRPARRREPACCVRSAGRTAAWSASRPPCPGRA